MLVLNDLSIRIAGRLLIDSASVNVAAGSRVGLIGRNGTGKTTLFSAIAGELAPESGSIALPPRWRIGRLAQEAPASEQSLISIVTAADSERTALLAEANTATDPLRIAEIQTRLADIGAHAAPARAAAILAGLGFTADQHEKPASAFSGGWRMRVALAAMLFAEPDLLLLDEPTNYLDLEGTLWLQEYLARYRHTCIVISHDRDLLDQAVTSILSLENRKLTAYAGNYTTFERTRRERLALDMKFAKKQEAQRKHLEAFIARFRAKATKARQAQSRMKILEKMQPVTALVSSEVRPFHFPAAQKQLAPPIIALEGVSVGYEPDRPVLRRIDARIDPDDRIALLGANGNGKSTFVKLLSQRLPPMSGRLTLAPRLSVAYFAQHQLDELNPDASVYDHVRKLMPDATEAQTRARAGQIGFSEGAADSLVKTLSGGEKARLLLGLATFDGPHLIILDEPTNHLDIDSRAALAEAINEFSGAVILVSHDRYLLEACADRLWIVRDGTVQAFEGDLDDYRRVVLGGSPGRRDDAGEGATDARRTVRRQAAEKRAETAPLRRQIAAMEKTIGDLTKKIAETETAMAAPGLFARDPGAAGRLGKQHAEFKRALDDAEEEWLSASAELEQRMQD